MTPGAQRLQQRVSAQASLSQGVHQRRVAGAPGAQQAKPDQGARHGAVVRGQGGRQRQNVCKRGAVVRYLQWRVMFHAWPLQRRRVGRRRRASVRPPDHHLRQHCIGQQIGARSQKEREQIPQLACTIVQRRGG